MAQRTVREAVSGTAFAPVVFFSWSAYVGAGRKLQHSRRSIHVEIIGGSRRRQPDLKGARTSNGNINAHSG